MAQTSNVSSLRADTEPASTENCTRLNLATCRPARPGSSVLILRVCSSLQFVSNCWAKGFYLFIYGGSANTSKCKECKKTKVFGKDGKSKDKMESFCQIIIYVSNYKGVFLFAFFL